MKMKLLTLEYQRNGVSGEGFFAATVKNLNDTKGLFLITFTTKDKTADASESLDTTQCRCVMLEGRQNPFYQCWRGDNIGNDLQKHLDELKEKFNLESYYDIHTMYENNATKSKYEVRYNKQTEKLKP